MPVSDVFPILSFVNQPKDLNSIIQASENQFQIICDLTGINSGEFPKLLGQLTNTVHNASIKISYELLQNDRVIDTVIENGVRTVYVELTYAPLVEIADLLNRMAELSDRITFIPIVGDFSTIRLTVDKYPQISRIALKGCEASGFVSKETIFTLYSGVKNLLRNSRNKDVSLSIWGGIATAEAAAAFLSTGAQEIVFESLHWLTDFVTAESELKQKLAKLRVDHTDLVGLNLQVPCRFFNRGNSKAVRKLREFASMICGAEIDNAIRQKFIREVIINSVHPLESIFGKDELIPLGIEAAFAASFAERYGYESSKAISAFIDDIDRHLAASPSKLNFFQDNGTAKAMGIRYPFVQGGMSWISDNPDFAVEVAKSGALPTLALGMMDQETLVRKLSNLPEIMSGFPYAVNVITLNENPFRSQQLEWIIATKPKFAVIAAGEPSHGAELLKSGIEVIYIAPNEELMRLAFETGIKYVVCEGNEAGGHVGQHTTLTLAQNIIELKRKNPGLFAGKKVILAGGICNRETAFMAAMLGADAIQMGTVYLASSEIVKTGALTSVYQQMVLDADPDSTVITGESTGLRVRSIKTPCIDAICTLERDFMSGSEDESSFRHKIETLSAGSLFVAAKGLDRESRKPLSSNACEDQGQFMSGACAGTISQVMNLAELHHELAVAALDEGLPFTGPLTRTDHRKSPRPKASYRTSYVFEGPERIAITGMSVVNSLGNSPQEVWANTLAMRSGIIPVPPTKWDHSLFYHPRPRMPEKTYCKVAAFQNIEITRKDIGVPPQDFRTMTDATKITMWLAAQAIEESGIIESDIPRERIAVLSSQNSGEAAVTLQDVIIRGCSDKIVGAVKRVVQLTPDMEAAVAEEVKCGRIAIDDTTLLGRLNCSAGGFICNKYGFMGPSFSVSAACATALVALYSAYQMIRNGIIDAAIVGGGEEYLTPMHFLEFSALGALAGLSGVERRPEETSRPFDADRDGMVLGEGGGIIVIERESIAKKRGAKIHAYITSMGASNNHLGMVESSRVTQELAIKASFRDAPYGPEKVNMIECHATSTRQGDVEEVHALKSFYKNSDAKTVLTSFKSQIGHTLGASGVNSMIRGIMAMQAGVIPGTLNFHHPDPDLILNDSSLEIHAEPIDWKLRNGDPRRMQVNAFGFGGSNYVVQLEGAQDCEARITVDVEHPSTYTSTVIKEENTAMPEGISFFKTEIAGTSYRVAIPAETQIKAKNMLAGTDPIVNGGGLSAKRIKSLARQGIFIAPEGTPPKIAFVFPGQGSHYAGMSHELYQNVPIIREWMDKAAEVADFDILDLIFHNKEEDLQKTRWQQPALFTMEFAMVQYLWSLGLRPSAMAGHSLGELTALCLAGVYSFEDGFRIVNMRAICMDKACGMHMDPGVMMAVDAPMDVLTEMMGSKDDVYITNINSPHQLVVGGNSEQIKILGAELKENGYRNTLLRVSMAFHSPIMQCIHDDLEKFIADIEFHAPKIPVISNTTMQPFPSDTAEIKRIVMAHLESPVHWMQNVRTLWEDFGVRLFIEVGPREILSNLIADSIEEAECIPTCLPGAETVMLRNAVAQLYAKGAIDFSEPITEIEFPRTAKGAESTQTAVAPKPLPSVALAAAQPSSGSLEAIVQSEINAFVMESFGRFLKPSILAAIQNRVDPQFSTEHLEQLLSYMFPGVHSQPAAQIPGPISLPARPETAFESLHPPVITSPSPPVRQAPVEQDTTETVIRIIMEATGYERDEIEPDMDLREDLSIRSSRLPVIMDSVEGHFGIKIELEDFMDVRTIRDISERISVIISREIQKAPSRKTKSGPALTIEEPSEVIDDAESLKRITFKETPVEFGTLQPVEMNPLDTVAVLCATRGTGLRKRIGDIVRRDYGVGILPMTFLEEPDAEAGNFDFRTESGINDALKMVENVESLSGVVFIIDDVLETQLHSMGDISSVLKGFFSIMKTFVESSSKKLALVIHRSESLRANGRLLAEGMLGTFLSAAQEFSSVQFRTVRLDDNTDLRDAMRAACDRSQKNVEMIWHDGECFTRAGSVTPVMCDDQQKFIISKDDVILFTGGCSGIAPFLANAFVPFGCKIAFTGRTRIDPTINYRLLDTDAEIESHIRDKNPQIPESELLRTFSHIKKARDVVVTLDSLKTKGIQAEYFTCDVGDAVQAAALTNSVIERFGGLTGIVHGAGILKDNFIKQLSAQDFADVVNVKFLGAANLFQAAKKSGLRFFVVLSSAASIQGNPGQSNYAAANRIMSAFTSNLASRHGAIKVKALMLPPIAGAGMAENPEIKDLMRRMNASYVHADELASLLARELTLSASRDVWVLFMRSLPDLSTVKLNTKVPYSKNELVVGTTAFKSDLYPMIDKLAKADLVNGELVAQRTFSLNDDLWIPDHKPFKFMKHPLVSAIMAIETFMEASKMLFPHLNIKGIREAEFLDIIECMPGVDRFSEVVCHRLDDKCGNVECELVIATREVSPTGRVMERITPNYRAHVLLGEFHESDFGDQSGFPVRNDELDSRPMDKDEVVQWYENRTDMKDRYRILEHLDGTAHGAVKGHIVYRTSTDFKKPRKSNYVYSPYLLEALMQVVNFYIVMRDTSEQRSMIPFRIGEMIFARKCIDGERLTLEGRMVSQDDEGITWNARATDEKGRTVMMARNVRMRWFS